MTHSPAPAKARVDWIDAARGFSVLAVVLYHVGHWHFLKFEHSANIAFTLWENGATALSTVRMPLLLAVSGMLAASKIRSGFSSGRVRDSSLTNYYLYAVWLLIYALLGIPVALSGLAPRIDSISDFLLQLLAPDTPLWFVYALALYVPLFTLCRTMPPIAVLGALLVLRLVTAMTTDSDTFQWWKIPELALFFAIGVYGKGLFLRIAGAHQLLGAAIAIPAFLGLSVLSLALDMDPFLYQVIFTLRGVAAVVALVAVISALTRNRAMAAGGSFIGRRTLGIYLLHAPVIDGIVLAFHGPFSPAASAVAGSIPLALIYPLVLTAAVVAACLGLNHLCNACGLEFLFRRPQAKAPWSISRRQRLAPGTAQDSPPGRHGLGRVS